MELVMLDNSTAMQNSVSHLWEQYACFFEFEKLEPDYYKNSFTEELSALIGNKDGMEQTDEHVYLLMDNAHDSTYQKVNNQTYAPICHGLGILKIIDQKTCELKRFIVDEKSRGQGIGKKMLALFEKKTAELGFEKIILDVFITKSAAALKVYSDAGFKKYKTSTYRTPDDVVYMQKPIKSEALD